MDLQIYAISIKIPTAFFYRNKYTDPIINMYMQETQNSQNNIENEEHGWRAHTPSIQNLQQRNSN